MDDLDYLIEVSARFNRKVDPGTAWDAAKAPVARDRPGDRFNADGPDWRDLLEPAGWVLARGGNDGVRYWRRPDKGEGHSATTGFCSSEAGGDLLYVFSTNAKPFESQKCYSKFSAYAILHHGGDFRAAAEDVVRQGYGEPAIQFRTGREDDAPPAATPGEVPGSVERGLWQPIPASLLRRLPENEKWLWYGCLSRTGVTLLSALWKAGKTTLLAHLFRALEHDGFFCGLAIKKARVLVVSEESETIWAERRDDLTLKDHLEFLPRPFLAKPLAPEWMKFMECLRGLTRDRGYDLIVFDTLSKLWPVREENDAPQVEAALMPLHMLTERAAVLLVHHLRKGDGGEATGSRGSGGLTAFVDTILELRRYAPADRRNTRRVLTGYGRFRETPDELVIELAAGGYAAVEGGGGKEQIARRDYRQTVLAALPVTEPGLMIDQITERVKMSTKTLLPVLWECVEGGEVVFSGNGKRGDPYLFRRVSMSQNGA